GETGGVRVGRGHGGGGQRDEASRGGQRLDGPLTAAGQPRTGQQPGYRPGRERHLGQKRAEVFGHRATRWMTARAAGSMTVRRNCGATPITTDAARSGTMATATLSCTSRKAGAAPGPPG